MSEFDLDQARYYIKLLKGDEKAPVHWQFYDDSKQSKRSFEFYCSLDDAHASIVNYQKQGLGVYVTVNPTDGNGRKIENITGYEWCFADLDGVDLPDEFPLQPSFITGRGKSNTHVYWGVEGCLTSQQYMALQRRIAMHLGSDTQVTDPSRVLRLPGSLHLKDLNNPKRYTVMQDNQHDFNYTVDEIVDAFTLTQEQEAELSKWLDSREGATEGTGFSDDPIYIQAATKYYSEVAKPSMGEGTGRSENVLRVANYGIDRGISYDINAVLMWDHFNPRCMPPWDESEKNIFFEYVKRAYRYRKSEPGCRTAAGSFANNCDEPFEPVHGWEKEYALAKDLAKGKEVDPVRVANPETLNINFDIGCVSTVDANMDSIDITSKAKEHTLALFFLGKLYPDRRLIRKDSVFYGYNGEHWEIVIDEKIMYQIETLFRDLELSTSKIKNIFIKLTTFCFYDFKFKNGVWLSKKSLPDSCMNTKNGIVTIDNNSHNLIPFDQDFFSLNQLAYAYDPSAKCPEYIAWVNEQFNHDQSTIRSLQEMYGMLLLGDNRFQTIFMLVGKSRSGKGVHCRIIENLVGHHNVCSPSLEGLVNDSKVIEMTTTKITMIPEANNVSSKNKAIILDRLKAISGNDPLQVDRKFKGAVMVSNWSPILMTANELPQFTDSSAAFANRILPFKFTKSYAGREDPMLVERLTSPESMAGILNWAIEGALRAIKNNRIHRSEASAEMIEDIRHDTNPLSNFVADCCDLDPDAEIPVTDLYLAFKSYSISNGVRNSASQRTFSSMLSSSPLPIMKERNRRGSKGRAEYKFVGIKLSTEGLKYVSPLNNNVSNITDAAERFAKNGNK